MSRKHRQPPAAKASQLLVEVDGANIATMVIAGEAWVSPAVYLQALEQIEFQASEIERLTNGNGASAVHHVVENIATQPKVKKHLRCPLCFDGEGGRARMPGKWVRSVSAALKRMAYTCANCGHVWVVEVRTEEVNEVVYTTTRIVEVRTNG